jgi:uncharacterized protein GlcG (DUF336 family)
MPETGTLFSPWGFPSQLEENMKNLSTALVAALFVCASFGAAAQVPQYGTSINLEQARKAIAAGQVEARKNGWPVAIAIVDNAGMLVAYERMDNTQTGSVQVAIDKAASAAMYRRPTKVFQDAVAGGGAGTRILGLRGASPVEGGLTLAMDGKIVGGIGVSGVNADQDGVVAKAGADVIK